MKEGQELQKLFIKYLVKYISKLTEGKEEFFISLCDMEEESLRGLDNGISDSYVTIVMDSKDYSEAVRVRNDVGVKQIVLLSGEGVKQIDSLKDFNEYSVLCDDREWLWECIEHTFTVRLAKKRREFLNVILDEGEVSFWEFFKYLYKSISAGADFSQMNQNLPMLGIWSSTKKTVLPKGEIRRMIRLSKEEIVERKLTKALAENKIKKRERYISDHLAKRDIQAILDDISYETAKEWLKGPVKGGDSGPSSTGDDGEEKNYTCSYEYVIREDLSIDIKELENTWVEERRKELSELDFKLDWELYEGVGQKEDHKKQIDALIKTIRKMNIPETKINQFSEKLIHFYELFEEGYARAVQYTPVCLSGFCDTAMDYTQAYFSVLSDALTDNMIRQGLLKSGIISQLECLFCHVEAAKIEMPFYHPVNVLYYIGLRQMYEFIIEQEFSEEITEIEQKTMLALLKKLGMKFPVGFIRWQEELYAIDYTTIWNQGKVEFTNTNGEVVYSALDMRIIHKQILDYIIRHPVRTEITIALLEISDLNGLSQIVDRIRQMSRSKDCNIGRVDFLILSSREEILKKQLSGMWDILGTDEIVRFRFGRSNYCTKKGYDIKKIIDTADITIIADSSTLYYEPRMERFRKDINSLRNRLTDIDVEKQVRDYFVRNHSDINILWDTLQQAERSREEGFWHWKSKEIDSSVLSYVNEVVSNDLQRTIVILSSNDGILSDIYKSHYIQAHRRNDNGKSITIINFDNRNRANLLPLQGNAEITYSLSEFYNAALDISDAVKFLSGEMADINIKLYLEDGSFYILCVAYGEDAKETNQAWRQECQEWLSWQLDIFPKKETILGNYFLDLLLNYWLEGVRSVTAALMVRKLFQGGNITLRYEYKNLEEKAEVKDTPEDDCMEAVKIQEMFRFIHNKSVIDSQSARQFSDRYEAEMLERVLSCDQKEHILDKEEREKLEEIQRKIKGE